MKRVLCILLLLAQSAHAAPPRLPITKRVADHQTIDGKAKVSVREVGK